MGRTTSMILLLPITKAIEFIRNLKLGEKEAVIAERVVKEILAARVLRSVGLDYLTLSRRSTAFPEEKISASAWLHRSVHHW